MTALATALVTVAIVFADFGASALHFSQKERQGWDLTCTVALFLFAAYIASEFIQRSDREGES